MKRWAVDKFDVEYGTIDNFSLNESESSVRARSRTDYEKTGLSQHVLDHQRSRGLVFSDENTTALGVRPHRATLRLSPSAKETRCSWKRCSVLNSTGARQRRPSADRSTAGRGVKYRYSRQRSAATARRYGEAAATWIAAFEQCGDRRLGSLYLFVFAIGAVQWFSYTYGFARLAAVRHLQAGALTTNVGQQFA
jgi:hypothetical protein